MNSSALAFYCDNESIHSRSFISTAGQRNGDLRYAVPPTDPDTVIVQHMPEKFTASFAQYLNTLCSVEPQKAAQRAVEFAGRGYTAQEWFAATARSMGRRASGRTSPWLLRCARRWARRIR